MYVHTYLIFWATKQVLATYARHFGTTFTYLNVSTILQDKSEWAANHIQDEFCSTVPSTPVGTSTPDQSLNLSPKNKRKGSASYWKEKIDQVQLLIKEMAEKSIQLEGITDVFTLKKVKPNLEKNISKIDAGTWLNAS